MATYENTRSSLIKLCQEQITLLKAAGVSSDMEFFDFDDHVDTKAFPEKDLLGMWGLSMESDAPILTVSAQIGISTLKDKGRFRHHKAIDALFDRLQPTRTVQIVDATTGALQSILVVTTGTAVAPMMNTDSRALQFVMVTMQTAEFSDG